MIQKTIVSWMAFLRDFEERDGKLQVAMDSPNVVLHMMDEYVFNHHVILYTSETESEEKQQILGQYLNQHFAHHSVEFRRVSLEDAGLIALDQIQNRIEPILQEFREDELTFYVSPGTAAMNTAWHILHLRTEYDSSLVQIRPAKYNHHVPEWLKIDFDRSGIPGMLIAQEVERRGTVATDFIKVKALEPVYEMATKVAVADSVPVLILGETGTGKERLARYIHDNSPRRDEKFFPVNCAAQSDELLQSLLFGHVKGAFTGAMRDKPGYFELAEGSTLFLDEIGDISPFMQQSLLRVLQEKKILRVGGEKEIEVDVRIIAATNRKLMEKCRKGEFRWDLYHRLSVVELELPAISQWSRSDRETMIEAMWDRAVGRYRSQQKIKRSQQLKKVLLDHRFPGNIRELENIVARLCVLAEDKADVEHLPRAFRESGDFRPQSLKAMEKDHIENMLRYCEGNKKRTAEQLEISRNTLDNKLKSYHIEF